MVNSNFTSAPYVLNSSSDSLHLEIQPVNFTGLVTTYTVNVPRVSLANYQSINVTATGSNNTLVLLGFTLDDGNRFDIANWTDVDTLNAGSFDLAPYSNRSLRGDGYLAIMSANGTRAEIDISQITFETSKPVITYTPKIERVDLQVVGIYDSKHPGIGSQYPGIVFKLEHLQQWMSLENPQRKTDLIKNYLIALKTDHFTSEINKDYLKKQVDLAEAAIPEGLDQCNGQHRRKVYGIASPRLTFFSIAELIMTLLSTMLTALGLLIMITGVLLITNVQLMNVEDREFQTGVLRAVGENRRGITQIHVNRKCFPRNSRRNIWLSRRISVWSNSCELPRNPIWHRGTKCSASCFATSRSFISNMRE